MSNERIERWSETFNQALQERGLFVRDYDDAGKVQPYAAADALHRMLCSFDLTRRGPWMALTLGEFADVYGEAMDLRRFIGEETWECNISITGVQGKLRKEEAAQAAQAERIQELEGKLRKIREWSTQQAGARRKREEIIKELEGKLSRLQGIIEAKAHRDTWGEASTMKVVSE